MRPPPSPLRAEQERDAADAAADGEGREGEECVSTFNPRGLWPAGPQATACLAGLQKLLDARGVAATDRRVKPLLRKAADAFQAHDLAGVTAACDALVDLLEGAAGPRAEAAAPKNRLRK